MKFTYIQYGSSLRPVIPIKLKRGNLFVSYEVLVDSGADICLFSESVGKALGINVRNGEIHELFGVGGKASIFFMHNIVIEIGNKDYKIEAGFMHDIAGRVMPYGIVGQNGFFDIFTVKFDLLKEEIELKERKKFNKNYR